MLDGHPSLRVVPERVLDELGRARRGVIVLAADGLGHAVAAQHWQPSTLDCLSSTVPSTSTTAWLTALTGVGPAEHGVVGMVFRLPAEGSLVCAVNGTTLAHGPAEPAAPAGLVWPHPTVFDRATTLGVRCVAIGREIDGLTGPWAPALLAGSTRADSLAADRLAEQAADPRRLTDGVAADVDTVLTSGTPTPTLLWIYVNLDDYVHRNGYDDAVCDAVAGLGRHAERWAGAGWTVLCHSDHGQVRCEPDPDLVRAWAAVDDPRDCLLPSGGAGRIRWLYPRPGNEARVAARLAEALGDAAVVLPAEDMPELGSACAAGSLRGRVGAVVAIAASERFPVPDPSLSYEHGGLDPAELLVPFAVWRG